MALNMTASWCTWNDAETMAINTAADASHNTTVVCLGGCNSAATR